MDTDRVGVPVPINSAAIIAMNFILFDIILAPLVFYLTADIAGLVNSASALNKPDNRLHAYNPLLVGVGLTCTRRNVFRWLALVRMMAMLALLATNFLIEGRSEEVVRWLPRDVVMASFLSASMKGIDVRRFALRRRSCQGRNGYNGLTYYGELRVDTETCELRPKLLTLPTVYFGTKLVQHIFKPPQGCNFSSLGYNHMHRFVCPNFGVVACNFSRSNGMTIVIANSCMGVVLAPHGENGKREAHLCKGEGLFPGLDAQKRKGNKAMCRLAINANTTDTTWVPLIGRQIDKNERGKVRTLQDAIDAVYGAVVQRMVVKVSTPDKTREVADIRYAWFVILAFKLLVIVVLIIIDLSLRSRGFVRAANDEFGLGSLLAQSVMTDPLLLEAMQSSAAPLSHESGNDGACPLLMVQNEGGVLRAHISHRLKRPTSTSTPPGA